MDININMNANGGNNIWENHMNEAHKQCIMHKNAKIVPWLDINHCIQKVEIFIAKQVETRRENRVDLYKLLCTVKEFAR